MSSVNGIRQGDVFLIPVGKNEVPKALKVRQDCRVALGEHTGHAHHIIDGQVMVDESGNMFVTGEKNTTIQHLAHGNAPAEHATKTLVPDVTYKVVIQREYQPEGWRQVAD